MDPNTLRAKILCCVAEHEATGASATLDDADITVTLDAPLDDVRWIPTTSRSGSLCH
jgi:hypothetical protein